MDNAIPLGVDVNSAGEIAVAGYFQNNVNLGTGVLSSVGYADIFLAKYGADGTPQWVRQIGSAQDERAKSVAFDGSGNIVIGGLFRGAVDFGGGYISAAPFTGNGFLAKYEPDGDHLWSKRVSVGSSPDEVTALAVDGAGNVLFAGILYGTSDFGGGPLTTAGGMDVFLVKVSASGGHLWSRRGGGSSEDWVTALAADVNGNPVIAGYFNGSADFGSGSFSSAGRRDAFVAEYLSTGVPVWSRRFGGSLDEVARAVAVDGGGSVLLTGEFQSVVDFGGGALTNSAGADIFLAKLTTGGSHVWSKQFSGQSGYTLDEKSYAISTDSAGSVLITGSVVDVIDFGGGRLLSDGYYDIFIAKFSSAGVHAWSKRTGAGEGQAIAADGGANAIIAGDFSGTTPVNFGGGTLLSPGGLDLFLVKLGP
jgi:hypothetical protein